jgi:transposase-like protein
MVGQLERDLPEPLHLFAIPRHLWRKLRPTNVIERCFGKVRRSTRPMVVFTNVESVDRIISAIFSLQRGLEKPHPPTVYTSNLTSPLRSSLARLRQHC